MYKASLMLTAGNCPPYFGLWPLPASSGPSSSGWRLNPRCVTLSWYVEGTTWSLSRRIANPRSTNSVESQICDAEMACCWLVTLDHEMKLVHWCRFRWSNIWAADGQPTYNFAASFFSDWKDFTKKFPLQFFERNQGDYKHRVDHLLDEILGICDSLLFDFLSDQCCWGPHRRGPMYRGVFLQHCIWFVDPYFYRMDLRMTGVFL